MNEAPVLLIKDVLPPARRNKQQNKEEIKKENKKESKDERNEENNEYTRLICEIPATLTPDGKSCIFEVSPFVSIRFLLLQVCSISIFD